MQMGVQVAPVLQPIGAAERGALQKLDKFTPPAGSVGGTGGVYVLSHKSNASFKLLNEVLASGGHASFVPGDTETSDGSEAGAIVVSGIEREKLDGFVKENSLALRAVAAAPKDSIGVKKARVGLYRAWVPFIDEGWTRWILENFKFDPVALAQWRYSGGKFAREVRRHCDSGWFAGGDFQRFRSGERAGRVCGRDWRARSDGAARVRIGGRHADHV